MNKKQKNLIAKVLVIVVCAAMVLTTVLWAFQAIV